MASPSIVSSIQNKGKQYLQVYEDSTASHWQNYCGCQSPGLKLKCLTCPFAIEFVQILQQKLDPSSQLGMAQFSPPQQAAPYSEEIKQRCLKMFIFGYSLTQIKKFTGVESVVVLRRWLKESGIYKSAGEYSQEQKQQCLELYKAGNTPLEIEEKMKISGFIISKWVCSSGIPTRPRKTQYSEEQINLAIEMYVDGKSYSQIKALTGVSPHRVRQLAVEQKVQRKKKPKAGRPPVYSPETKQQCLDLVNQGFSLKQIEELTGVGTNSISLWHKDYLIQRS